MTRLSLLCLAALLAACGQKGPLVLPPKAATPAPAANATPAPAPAPAGAATPSDESGVPAAQP